MSVVWPIVYALDAVSPGCLRLLFSNTPFCREAEPGSFWLYLLLLLAILSGGIVTLIQTWRTIQPEVLKHETRLLRQWSQKGQAGKEQPLVFAPRATWAAWLIMTLWCAPFLYLAIIHQTIFPPPDFQLELAGVLIFGTLFVWLPVRWLSESLHLTPDGIQYHNLLRRGNIRPWSSFQHLELLDDGQRGSQGIRLRARWFGSDIVINRNTLHKQDDFVAACRFIIAAMLKHQVPIHLSLSGVEQWTESCKN